MQGTRKEVDESDRVSYHYFFLFIRIFFCCAFEIVCHFIIMFFTLPDLTMIGHSMRFAHLKL